MLFMYWTHPDLKDPPGAPAWRQLYPEFRVFTDEDVIPLLPEAFIDVFKSIRLPAAKSDIARFFLLRRYGGLYMDAHFGPTAPARLLETLDKLSAYSVIVFGQGWEMKKETDFDLMNGIVAARKAAPPLDLIINRIVKNVLDHKSREDSTSEYVPYNLWGMTGTYVIVQEFFDQVHPRPRIKAHLEEEVFPHFMKNNSDSGFEISAYNVYRKPGNHWSERQSIERFFLD